MSLTKFCEQKEVRNRLAPFRPDQSRKIGVPLKVEPRSMRRGPIGTAIDYLIRWRMLLAGDRLKHSGDPISIIAQSLGYESESAFSTAFKRVMGCSPRKYSRGRDSVSASH